LHAASRKHRTQKIAKNSPSAHHRTTLSVYIFATKAHVDNQKKVVKQQSLTCPHNMVNFGLLTAEIGWQVWGTPAKFNGFSRLAFHTAATSLIGSQPNFERCLAVYWAGALYTFSGAFCRLTKFCPVQNSLYVQVLRSPVLAALPLLHGTPAAGVSHALRHGTRNGITELSQRAPPISAGHSHHVGHRPTF